MPAMKHIGGPIVPRKAGHVPYDRSAKVARLLLERYDGCTVWAGTNGFAPMYIETSGYSQWIVGGKRPTIKFSVGDPTPEVVQLIARWIDSHPVDEMPYYGSWVEGGVVYIDAVDVYATQGIAVMVGQQRGEIAIYNMLTEETFRLK